MEQRMNDVDDQAFTRSSTMKETEGSLIENRQTNLNSIPRHLVSWWQNTFCRVNTTRLKNCLAVRYSPDLLIAITLISGLNILDYFFTMFILDEGGKEINPIVQSAMEAWGSHFWIWKFVLVSVALILLCLRSKSGYVRIAIFAATSLYLAVIFYQISILNRL